MKRNHLFGFLGALVALTLTCALSTRGEDPASPASAPAAAEKPAPPPVAEPVQPVAPAATAAVEAPAPPVAAPAVEAPAVPAVTPAPAPQAEPSAPQPEATPAPPTDLRRLDTETPSTATDVNKEIKETVKAAVRKAAAKPRTGNEKVTFGYGSHVAKDEKADAAVSIFGSTTVDGEVTDAAVSILGDTTVNGSAGDAAVSVFGTTRVNGSVGGAAVAVLGDVYVNGTVRGEVVAVMGNVELGPKAVVKGDIVTVGGTLQRDPQAIVKGNVQTVSVGKRFPHLGGLSAWVKSALLKGRLLSFASGTGWAWLVAAAFLGFYVLLALVFRRGVEKCAETLEERPGFTVLTALLTMLAMPLVFLLLAITGIGILVIPFLAVALWVGKIFGRVAMRAWLGRRLAGLFGSGVQLHAAVTVLIGGVLVILLYTVPILAFMVSAFIGFLGLGMVIYTLILTMRRNGAAKPAPAPGAGPGLITAAAVAPIGVPPVVTGEPPMAGAGEAAGFVAAAPVAAVAAPPAIGSAVTLPRAGFWIRLAASLLDILLISVAAAMIHLTSFGLLLFAAYCAVLWTLRGTTIGGIVCGLKVVRLDDRPVDWGVAIVRALAGFLSLAVVGLGFIWVAFDDEKQSWHDKIAGTTIVKVPKGVSLI
jgi:uncharacterized RDD family membrane protein YckC/cytoskeletal protein CcmA (bactofilin family)